VFLDDALRGQVVDLHGGNVLVGSEADCDVIVRNDHVSRRHALITNSDGHTYVEDLRSLNGTAANGEPCTGRTELHDGDTIRFADVAARYEVVVPESGPKTELQPVVQPSIASPTHGVQYEIGHQEADSIHNVGRDQYLIEQRDSFARDIASTKSKARFWIWTGAALAVAGIVVAGVGFYRYSNGFTSFNQNTTSDQFSSLARSYFQFFLIGGAIELLGMILIVVGIVLHVVAASRRKQLYANPAWSNLPPSSRGLR
jgi:pSer/pThr/pTyr-binding forkhead associated (FHA) protein